MYSSKNADQSQNDNVQMKDTSSNQVDLSLKPSDDEEGISKKLERLTGSSYIGFETWCEGSDELINEV